MVVCRHLLADHLGTVVLVERDQSAVIRPCVVGLVCKPGNAVLLPARRNLRVGVEILKNVSRLWYIVCGAALDPLVGEQLARVRNHQPWIDRPRSEEAVANTCGADVQARPDPSGEDAGERGRFDELQHARLILRRSAKDTHSVYQNNSWERIGGDESRGQI